MRLISALLGVALVISQGLAASVPGKEMYVPLIKEGESEPSCALGRNYCEHVDNYPRETIMKLLQRFDDVPRELTNFIFDDNLEESGQIFDGHGGNTENRHVNASVVNSQKIFCDVMALTIRPVVAKTNNNEWLYIVNVIGRSQTIHTELCQGVEKTCSTLHKYIGKCEQEHREEKLLALDSSGKSLIPVDIVVNSCCLCTLYDKPKHW